ncbi:unnamed protein product, partial [Mesorhabditis spiculigera]
MTIKSPKSPRIQVLHAKSGYDAAVYKQFEDAKVKNMFDSDPSIFDSLELLAAFFELTIHVCNNTLADKELIADLQAAKIDLAFHHHMDFCQMSLIHHVGIKKWIYFSSLPPYPSLLNSVGEIVPTSVSPSYALQHGNQMSFLKRAQNFIYETLNAYFRLVKQARAQTELARRHLGRDVPDLEYFPKNANLMMLSTDAVLEFPIPTTQKVVHLGGFAAANSVGALNEKFSTFIAKSSKVAVVSFGSWAVTERMPSAWKEALLNLFRAHPDTHFIWSCEEEIEVPENVLRTNWIPQAALLANPKTKIFITHAGYNSLMEAVQFGVPTISVPLFSFGDQVRNAHLFEQHGVSIRIEKREFTTEKLQGAYKEILENLSFEKRSEELKRIIKKRPSTAEQELNYWVDVVLNTEIDLNLPNLSAFEFYSLDIMLFFVALIFAFFLFIRALGFWYYWSCYEMAYKQKVKLQ